jgi:hypothetical protein
MLDEFARCVFDKFASSKAAISTFLLDEFARRANLSLRLSTLHDSVNAPLDTNYTLTLHVNGTCCTQSRGNECEYTTFQLRTYMQATLRIQAKFNETTFSSPCSSSEEREQLAVL